MSRFCYIIKAQGKLIVDGTVCDFQIPDTCGHTNINELLEDLEFDEMLYYFCADIDPDIETSYDGGIKYVNGIVHIEHKVYSDRYDLIQRIREIYSKSELADALTEWFYDAQIMPENCKLFVDEIKYLLVDKVESNESIDDSCD